MSKHRAARARRRVVVLVGAVIVSAGLGVTAVVVAPQVRAGDTGTTPSASAAAIETSTLEAVSAPVVETAEPPAEPEPAAVPKGSGEGRRIVFDQSDQRVWLVDADGEAERTYLVSGSRFDNLRPGSYQVQSRTRQATAFDYSGTMEYFVRFATGYSEPIGFHSVPRDNAGRLEQTEDQLGTPLSAGCVRQWEPDAIALWDFAPVGTPVVVTA